MLRPPAEKDKDLLLALRNDVEIQRALMALPRANTRQRVDDWLAKMMNDTQSVFFIIARMADDVAVGFIQLTQMDFVHGTGQLGLCVDRAAHGKGHAADALSLLEEYVTGIFNLRKIVLRVLVSNQRAIAFYRKHRFEIVGIHQAHFYQEGAFHDVMIMEKLLAARSGA